MRKNRLGNTDIEATHLSFGGIKLQKNMPDKSERSEERRVGKECRSRWSPYH